MPDLLTDIGQKLTKFHDRSNKIYTVCKIYYSFWRNWWGMGGEEGTQILKAVSAVYSKRQLIEKLTTCTTC